VIVQLPSVIRNMITRLSRSIAIAIYLMHVVNVGTLFYLCFFSLMCIGFWLICLLCVWLCVHRVYVCVCLCVVRMTCTYVWYTYYIYISFLP